MRVNLAIIIPRVLKVFGNLGLQNQILTLSGWFFLHPDGFLFLEAALHHLS